MGKSKKKKVVAPLVRLEFVNAKPAVLQDRAHTVIDSCTNNPKVTGEGQEYVATIKELSIKYDAVVLKVMNGNKTLIDERDELGGVLSITLYYLATWVMNAARGSADFIKRCGFLVDGESPKPKPEFGAPQNLRIRISKELGTIWAVVDAVGKVNFYTFECAEIMADGTMGPWQKHDNAYVNYHFTGLIPGRVYCIRVAAVSKEKQVLYSSTIKATSGVGE